MTTLKNEITELLMRRRKCRMTYRAWKKCDSSKQGKENRVPAQENRVPAQDNPAPAKRIRRTSQKHAGEEWQLIKTCSCPYGFWGINAIEKIISYDKPLRTSGPFFEKEDPCRRDHGRHPACTGSSTARGDQ